ncbi:hypothetical protein RIF29_12131 [Crotalaria pallida]|uniref:Uncharacterized protein n=1 Tax=Crotalaria pallida TaxID=3830 RepID=A0AAN9IN13_CROPI
MLYINYYYTAFEHILLHDPSMAPYFLVTVPYLFPLCFSDFTAVVTNPNAMSLEVWHTSYDDKQQLF